MESYYGFSLAPLSGNPTILEHKIKSGNPPWLGLAVLDTVVKAVAYEIRKRYSKQTLETHFKSVYA